MWHQSLYIADIRKFFFFPNSKKQTKTEKNFFFLKNWNKLAITLQEMNFFFMRAVASPNAKKRFTIRESEVLPSYHSLPDPQRKCKRELVYIYRLRDRDSRIYICLVHMYSNHINLLLCRAFRTGERVRISSRFHRSLIQHRH